MLNSTNRDIQLALYKLSRVVDTGNFHKVLENDEPVELDVLEGIPVCCVVNLKGKSPPLTLNIKYEDDKKRTDKEIAIYGSCSNPEPDAANFDYKCNERRSRITI